MTGQTFNPFDFNRTPIEEVLMPFPSPDKTPPVTMTYFTQSRECSIRRVGDKVCVLKSAIRCVRAHAAVRHGRMTRAKAYIDRTNR